MVQPPWWMKIFFPGTFWRGKVSEKIVYLTFDDGPIPEVTPWVLKLLKDKGIKATFFCVGENVAKHPHVFRMLSDDEHQVGNHTYHHVPSWRVSLKEYLSEVDLGNHYIQSDLFRPPHGQLSPWQIPSLKGRYNKIVMWDVLTKDYDRNLQSNQVFQHVVKHVRPGSVIVFHDSIKAWPNLEKALPQSIDWLIQQGYRFELIPR